MRAHGFLPKLAVLGAVFLSTATISADAKSILLNNSSSRRISTTIVVRTYAGWRVIGWYTIAPWSYRRLNIAEASGPYFGVYAHSGSLQWSGTGNQPVVAIVDNRMNHAVNTRPYGGNARLVRVRMVNGNAFKFTWQGDRQAQQTGGWW